MDYNKIARRVLHSLTKYGQDVTLRVVSSSVYDPATQTTSVSFTDTIRKALTTDQPGTRIGPQYGTNFKKDTLIQDGERWLYVDAMGPSPKIQDRMIVQGTEYQVADVQLTGPGGIPVFYLVVLRL